MTWNTPGSGSGKEGSSGGSKDKPNPWKPKGTGGGNDFSGWMDRLRGLFDGSGGGSPLRWVALGFLLIVVFSSFQLIGEQQRGVVLRFGQFSRIMQPGPNLKWPWPVESVTKVNATEIKNFNNTVSVLTRDENIVNIELNVQYSISDPKQYLFGTREPDLVLEQVAQSAVREQVGRSDLDAALNARGPLVVLATQNLQKSLDLYHTGLTVTKLSLQNARPPEEVKPAFDEANSAQQVKDRLISEARAYAAKVVPEARGEASSTRTAAEGYKATSIARSQGDADRFTLLQTQYKAAPEVTRKRLWLETVQQVLSQNRKVIGGDGRQLIYVPMPAQATAGTSAAAQANTQASNAAQAVVSTEALMPAVESNPAGGRTERNPRPTGREEPQR